LDHADIHSLFTGNGGQFCISAPDLFKKLQNVKAFLFDWDGVFNDGSRKDKSGSGFSEPDAMGTNLLRFSYWLVHGKMPVTAIITGEENEASRVLGKREHFSSIYYNFPNKISPFAALLDTYQLKAEEVAFFFDDVLDLALAEKCGLRILCHRKSNPLFNDFIVKNKLADYITSSPGGHTAVREGAELLIGLHNNYAEAVTNRMHFSEKYQQYLADKKSIEIALTNGHA
jgi:3-deoxy-D-manno-octulosonate 8-phosphate phosphatase (KDO 8-P phosphatase)